MLSRVEPFGMATIECMGMGCLPVAWDIQTGTREILRVAMAIRRRLETTITLAARVLEACGATAGRRDSAIAHARENFSESAMWRGYSRSYRPLVDAAQIIRSGRGRRAPDYRPPVRMFQLLPKGARNTVRWAVGRSARSAIGCAIFVAI